jgi:hypothetical protein
VVDRLVGRVAWNHRLSFGDLTFERACNPVDNSISVRRPAQSLFWNFVLRQRFCPAAVIAGDDKLIVSNQRNFPLGRRSNRARRDNNRYQKNCYPPQPPTFALAPIARDPLIGLIFIISLGSVYCRFLEVALILFVLIHSYPCTQFLMRAAECIPHTAAHTIPLIFEPSTRGICAALCHHEQRFARVTHRPGSYSPNDLDVSTF